MLAIAYYNPSKYIKFGLKRYADITWKHSPDGILSAKIAFDFLNPPSTVVPWAGLIWRSCIPPSSIPGLRGCFYLCSLLHESTSHLFLNCPFAVSIWKRNFSLFLTIPL